MLIICQFTVKASIFVTNSWPTGCGLPLQSTRGITVSECEILCLNYSGGICKWFNYYTGPDHNTCNLKPFCSESVFYGP